MTTNNKTLKMKHKSNNKSNNNSKHHNKSMKNFKKIVVALHLITNIRAIITNRC